LDIKSGNCKRASSATAEDIRRALQSLRLLSLAIKDLDRPTELPLLEALLGPTGFSEGGSADSALCPASTPLLCLWAPTLTDLSVCFSAILGDQPDTDRLMESVGRLQWSALQSLSLGFPATFGWPGGPGVAALLPSLLMRERMPQLQTLRMGHTYDGVSVIESALLAALPMISSTLTELDIKFELGWTEARADDWLPGFHLLPSLRVLRCNIHRRSPVTSAFACSIALAPKLEVLQFYSESAASEVCKQLRLL